MCNNISIATLVPQVRLILNQEHILFGNPVPLKFPEQLGTFSREHWAHYDFYMAANHLIVAMFGCYARLHCQRHRLIILIDRMSH